MESSGPGGKNGPALQSEGIPRNFNPKSISGVSFAKARAREIKTIMTDMKFIRNQTPAQSLPNHMRRRAMSHNTKRLPYRLRRTAEIRMQSSLATANKKTLAKLGSRKHRRRPKNLREEFAKRQGDKVWLETHLWHAKRFKMSLQWGYKIPLHPCDKSTRAAYRSTMRHCTIQDISFYEVIEVKGQEAEVIHGLSQLTSSATGLTMGAKMYLSGQHHGEVMLYHKGTYPYGAISRVQFVWRSLPADSSCDVDGQHQMESTEERQLWIWVHPSAFMEALEAIKSVLNSDLVTVSDLRGELTRLRLRGPQATAVVTDALKVSSIPTTDKMDSTKYWWQKKISENERLRHIHEQQNQFWNKMSSIQSCTELPSRCVIGLTVRDPRVLLPIQRTKVETDPTERDYSLPRCPTPGLSQSFSYLWEKDVCDKMVSTMQPTHEINKLRRNLLIPGSPLDMGAQESRVPVLLLQSPGVQRSTRGSSYADSSPLGFGSGWDIVLPKKWSPFFWVGFVYRGARAVGLKESYNTCLHQGVPRCPEDAPDSRSGCEFEELRSKELEEAFSRRPPAKRPNYAKLGFLTPFNCPWEKLLSEWIARLEDSNDQPTLAGTVGQFYVLRNLTHLKQLQVALTYCKKEDQRKKIKHRGQSQTGHNRPRTTRVPNEPSMAALGELDQRALVFVRVDLLQRGSPGAFSMICLPKDSDLESLRGKGKHPEPQETLKKQFRLDKKLKKGQKVPANRVTLKEKIANAKLLELNSRTIIGFVTNGGLVFSRGKGHAVGFCCLSGLLELAAKSSSHVLVRDTKSTQYRFADVTVVM